MSTRNQLGFGRMRLPEKSGGPTDFDNIYLKNLKSLFHIIDWGAAGDRSREAAEEKGLHLGAAPDTVPGAGRENVADTEKSLMD